MWMSFVHYQQRGNIASRFSSNPEAFASELIENLQEMSSDMLSMSKSSITMRGFNISSILLYILS